MSEPLTAYTISREQTIRNPGPNPRFLLPHERLVGIETTQGDTLWVAQSETTDVDQLFTEEGLHSQQLDLGADLNDRLVSFFKKFMHGREAFTPRRGDSYNGSGFAQWMLGDERCVGGLEAFTRGYMQERSMVEKGLPTEEHLRLGQLGVYGTSFLQRIYEDNKWQTREHYTPMASVMGLGESSDTCLQVLASQGHIAFTTYADADEHAVLARPAFIENHALYVEAPAMIH